MNRNAAPGVPVAARECCTVSTLRGHTKNRALALALACASGQKTTLTEGNEAMHDLWQVRHISVSIHCPPNEAYTFAANPENLPKWASGLAGSLKQVGSEWIAESPMGMVKIRFAEKNTFGVLDHDVTLPSGVMIHNPLRVLPNSNGSEVVFSVFRLPGTSDTKFAQDTDWVMRDLQTLKALLESRSLGDPNRIVLPAHGAGTGAS